MTCTENVRSDPFNDPESEEFRVASGYVLAMIWMAQADENGDKAGCEPFQYPDAEVRALCHMWLEGFKRSRTVPKFWDLFDRSLSGHSKDLLGFSQIPRPTEVNE